MGGERWERKGEAMGEDGKEECEGVRGEGECERGVAKVKKGVVERQRWQPSSSKGCGASGSYARPVVPPVEVALSVHWS